jgi:hypothetical protein
LKTEKSIYTKSRIGKECRRGQAIMLAVKS